MLNTSTTEGGILFMNVQGPLMTKYKYINIYIQY